jgi:ribosomal protein S18 acetylase RimI-like enzyme
LERLGPADRQQVAAQLQSLSLGDRVLRFGHLATDERISHYAAQIDFTRDEVFGMVDGNGTLMAVGHLAFDAMGSDAEIGVAVSAHARGRSLGSDLFAHALRRARQRDAHHLRAHLALDNAPMLAIVQRAGARLLPDGGSNVIAELPLPSAGWRHRAWQGLFQRLCHPVF